MNSQNKDYCPVDQQDSKIEVQAKDLQPAEDKAEKKSTLILIIAVFVLLSVTVILMYAIFFNRQTATTMNQVETDQLTSAPTQASDTLESLKKEIESEQINDFETDLQAIEQDIEQL